MRKKLEFYSNGIKLSGLLEQPNSSTRAYALFAHCFTGGKDMAAASRIAAALTQQGIAVMRFDFTGLGNSDGDFANTNFSSNCVDLVNAVEYLRETYEAPKILIGHSLGGAAVLSMASQIPEALAVVTIGAPAGAHHVAHHFEASIDEINAKGQATVHLGDREFTIKKQFLDDIDGHEIKDLTDLKKAVLVLHAPLDDIVPIQEAEKIYMAAKHPKSFISLDNADHLLTRKSDSEYVAKVVAAWAEHYLPAEEKYQVNVRQGHVLVEERDHKFSEHVSTDSHYWLADEPYTVGGSNVGPDPYEHLLAALGTCTVMTLRMYAEQKQYPLHHISIELSHHRVHSEDCKNCEQGSGLMDVINRNIALQGNLTAEQKQKLSEIADKCPVHKTLSQQINITTQMHTKSRSDS